MISRQVDLSILERMIAPITHRGPDDRGIWLDVPAGIGFGHRRLAIIDLSEMGHQPMHSRDGRFVITYNGEIYNHAELRTELETSGHAPKGGWCGTSDTETLIEAIAAWGLEAALDRAVGMFAFALWDRKERRLQLVRDRFGEKPLYYGWAGGDFLFGSELKALRAHPRFDNPISRTALRAFASWGYVPAPLSIYDRVFKLEPGCILTISTEGASKPRSHADDPASTPGFTLKRYWNYRNVVLEGLDRPITDHSEALVELESVLAKAIRGQAIADVPVGAFLSGGIDSSTVVALYQKYSPTPVRTFTIGFGEAGFNEAEDAKAVARHFGTEHFEHYVTVEEARNVIPLLPRMYDEPFGDSSQIPTFLVSRFARKQVTVALSGDGGDELFGGYNRHFHAPRLWRQFRKVPGPVRRIVGSELGRVPARYWDNFGGMLPGKRSVQFGRQVQRTLDVAARARTLDDVYLGFVDEWNGLGNPAGGEALAAGEVDDFSGSVPGEALLMYRDAVSYLPDDILCKVDRAAMAVSLETRVPFLDHRVAALAARIPVHMKIRSGMGKRILRDLLYAEAPKSLFDRPKAGFAVPVGQWIKGPLRDWAEDLLDQRRLEQEGWFDPGIIRKRWDDHLADRRDSTSALWSILMFQAWLRDERQDLSIAA